MLPPEVHTFIGRYYGHRAHPVAVAVDGDGIEYIITKQNGHRTIGAYAPNGTWRTLAPSHVPDGLAWSLYWVQPV